MKKRKTRRISSGNKRADKFFKRVINILNSDKVWNIFLRKRIKSRNYARKKYEYICGAVDRDDDETYEIVLASDRRLHKSRVEIAKTLLHEVLHILYPQKREPEILELEYYWWEKFSKKQRLILKFYVPKRPMIKNNAA